MECWLCQEVKSKTKKGKKNSDIENENKLQKELKGVNKGLKKKTRQRKKWQKKREEFQKEKEQNQELKKANEDLWRKNEDLQNKNKELQRKLLLTGNDFFLSFSVNMINTYESCRPEYEDRNQVSLCLWR